MMRGRKRRERRKRRKRRLGALVGILILTLVVALDLLMRESSELGLYLVLCLMVPTIQRMMTTMIMNMMMMASVLRMLTIRDSWVVRLQRIVVGEVRMRMIMAMLVLEVKTEEEASMGVKTGGEMIGCGRRLRLLLLLLLLCIGGLVLAPVAVLVLATSVAAVVAAV